MNRDQAVGILGQRRADLQVFGVALISVFGSTARGEELPDSDIDIIVEFETPPGLRRFMGLKFQLEEWLGTTVDLVDRSAIRDRWRPEIERDAILVA